MEITQPRKIRAYCRVERCGLSWKRLGQRKSVPSISGFAIQRSSEWRVCSVISNLDRLARLALGDRGALRTRPAANTSLTCRRTRSQPRSLLSIAMLKSARSRGLSAISSRTRIDQTCFGCSGRFWPTMRPLFQATRAGAGREELSRHGKTPFHRAHPARPRADRIVSSLGR